MILRELINNESTIYHLEVPDDIKNIIKPVSYDEEGSWGPSHR